MSPMLISVENATSMDSGETDTAVCNNILESRAEQRRTVPSEFRKPAMQSRCTQPTSNRVMMLMPKLRREQRSKVSELAAAATVGTQDAATSSQRIHVPTIDKKSQETSRERRYLENNRLFLSCCFLQDERRKLCRVSGLTQASKIRVSTFEDRSSCSKEHTFFAEQPCRVFGLEQISGQRHCSSRATISQKTSPKFWRGLPTALRGTSESQDSCRPPVHV